MPRLKVCAEPTCPELTAESRCPQHRAASQRRQAGARRRAGDPSMDVYSTTAWRRTRSRFLRHHPMCAVCTEAATDVDHRIPRRILVAAGIANPDHPRWLQPLCASHHAHKTAAIDTPLLARLRAGEDPEALAAEASRACGQPLG